MELVYLWVEKYKNIENQGFNFSPRFECKYDKETKKLIINEKKEYVSIFPDNINVTAIVGENGSGKSSVLEILYIQSFKQNISAFYVYFNNNNQLVCNNKAIIIINKTHYTYQIENIKQKNLLSYINISHFINEDIDINNNNYYTIYSDLIFPYWDINAERDDKSDVINRYRNFKTQSIYFMLYDERKIDYLENLIQPQKIEYVEINFLKDDDYKDFYNEYGKSLSLNELLYIIFSNKHLEDFENNYVFDRELINNFVQSFDENRRMIIDTLIDSSNIKKNCLVVNRKNFYKVKQFFDLINQENDKFGKFELLFLNKCQKRIDLSSGEYLLLTYLIFLDISSSPIIIIDEIDIYLHPQWQKRFLALFFKSIKNKHFILTSHSPFLLSDLPKENVIFLEKGKQVYPDIETFGANIHTLLSHGFFMKNGLMGEFAKGKIDEAIKILNLKQLSEDDIKFCENIISIVGEPILKRQMQKMLDSKRLTKVDKIDALEAEIELMKHRIEMIRKNQ